MSIKENLEMLHKEINEISLKNNISDKNINILAVSKTKPIELLIEAYNSGQRLFGENKVQEAEVKVPQLPDDAEFHMIGHLQSNKVKKACQLFKCIQSVDSYKIANKINNTCLELDKVMDIYIEVNVANDINKSGFTIDGRFYEEFSNILNLKNVNVVGLMCIGANVDDKDIIRSSFRSLKALSDDLLSKNTNFYGTKLSMGMSNDYKEAILEGSTMIRVGSSIFGARSI